MRYTLLEMTQLILSSMDSDEVNDINDTVESLQVANLIRSCFYDAATDLNLHEHEDLIQLEPSNDNAKPCVMYTPSTTTRIDWIKYDCRDLDSNPDVDYKLLMHCDLHDFIEMTAGVRGNSTTNSQLISDDDGNDFTFYFENDRAPTYYTHFGSRTILFDSYDQSLDTTLQKSKTMCFGAKYPSFQMSNNFVPDLDPTQFSYLINRAKTRAFLELKQQANPDSSGEARRQKIVIQKRKRRLPDGTDFDRLPKFGRRAPVKRIPSHLRNGD